MIQWLRVLYASLGYAFFTTGDFNLNFGAVRGPSDQPGVFDDQLFLAWRENGQWQIRVWPCTTDPGLRLLKHPMNSKGCAILVPGQYRGAYKIGMHKGYKAMVQCRQVKVYRDDNRDAVLDHDPDTIDQGHFGINVHRAAEAKLTLGVGGWSAGCQVVANSRDHDSMMAIQHAAEAVWGAGVSYALFTTEEAEAAQLKVAKMLIDGIYPGHDCGNAVCPNLDVSP